MVLLFFRHPVPWRIESQRQILFAMKLWFEIGEKGGCGWLRGCEQCEIYWIMHFLLKLHICSMKSKVIFIFSSTFARNSGDIGRRLPKVRLSRFAVFLTLVVAGLKPLRYDSRCHGECHAVVVSSCSNANFDPNVKDGDDETSLAAANVPYFSHRLHYFPHLEGKGNMGQSEKLKTLQDL